MCGWERRSLGAGEPPGLNLGSPRRCTNRRSSPRKRGPRLGDVGVLGPGFPLSRERTEEEVLRLTLAALGILSRGYVVPEITPPRIHLFDELQFPRAIPLLDLSFAYQSGLARLMLLVPNQQLHSIVTGKSRHGSGPMLPDALNEVVCHAAVQRSVSSARKNINIEAHCTWLLGPRLRAPPRGRTELRRFKLSSSRSRAGSESACRARAARAGAAGRAPQAQC